MCRRRGLPTRIVSLSPVRLDEVAESFATIGRAAERTAAGEDLRDRFLDGTRQRPPVNPVRPRVAVVEWLHPPPPPRRWTPRMGRAAGARPAPAPAAGPGGRATWGELRSR